MWQDATIASRLESFQNPVRAQRLLLSLPGRGLTDEDAEGLLPSLLTALAQSPDPDRALVGVLRWSDAVANRVTAFNHLLEHPAALRNLCIIAGSSQYLTDILAANPDYFELVAYPQSGRTLRPRTSVYREACSLTRSAATLDLKLEALRRFKQREILRIGTRDLLEMSTMSESTEAFSDLADVIVRICLDLATGDGLGPPIAVIAMGKLGGRELNYSSDIDLLFVERGPQGSGDGAETANSLALDAAQALILNLTRDMHSGRLFRVDMRLRPEGRFGALVRTLESYKSYYENWAEPWELQALLKARAIAGDMELGSEFIRMVTPYIFKLTHSAAALASIRSNKRRMEARTRSGGSEWLNVKHGPGGIRDVEFLVQFLILHHGERNEKLREPGTLNALMALANAGLVGPSESRWLAEDYTFLRTVEHRLQLMYDQQTYALPQSESEQALVGRRSGFPTAEAFHRDYRRRTARVRALFIDIFYGENTGPDAMGDSKWGPLLEAPEEAVHIANANELLRRDGFEQPEGAWRVVQSVVVGLGYGSAHPEAREALLKVWPHLLRACSLSGDADAAFHGIETLALAAPSRAAVYRTLLEGPELLQRICRLGAGAPGLMKVLGRYPQWMDALVDLDQVSPDTRTLEAIQLSMRGRLPTITPQTAEIGAKSTLLDKISSAVQRERLLTACRDLWGAIEPAQASLELTAIAQAALGIVHNCVRMAGHAEFHQPAARRVLDGAVIVGLGKLGGAELGYYSDWDVLLICPDELQDNDSRNAARMAADWMAERLIGVVLDLRNRGLPVDLDPRLRPEGRLGSLTRTMSEFAAYYTDSALTWERQALIKARAISGPPAQCRRVEAAIAELLFARPPSELIEEDVVAMKRRIEAERLQTDERFRDLKLGNGGLSDIEFTVQLLQLQYGHKHAGLRVQGTVDALTAACAAGLIGSDEATTFIQTYQLLLALRNRLSLKMDRGVDLLPDTSSGIPSAYDGLSCYAPELDIRGSDPEKAICARMKTVRGLVIRRFYGAESE